MKIYKKTIVLESKTQIEFMDITAQVEDAVEGSGVREGQVVIFSAHTTMGVAINHNEPLLLQDFMRMLYKAAPVDDQYTHDLFELKKGTKTDGRSNGHSHCKALLVGVSETIPVSRAKMLLSPLQSIFAVEFDGSRKRDVLVQVNGE